MQIICSTQAITEACSNVQRCVPSKAVLPHLEGILIKTTENDELELSGFDSELGVTTVLGVRVEKAGACVLNAKTLCDILRHLPEETVSIECDEKNICTIRSGNAQYTLVGLDAREYPEIPRITQEKQFTVSQLTLRDMIRQTIFAVSVDDAKTIHRGVKFEITAGEIKLVALDGYRLAIRSEFTEYNGEPLSFVVPSKTLAEVMKLISENEGLTKIKIGARHIVFDIGSYSLISRLLEGDFLDYRTAIPNAKSELVRVNTKQLIDCIERASIIIAERNKSPIRFIFDTDHICISVTTALGSANDKIEASADGKRTEIGFNNRLLLDALRSCDTDEVLIRLNGPIAPAIIVPPEGEHFLYLILPIRLKTE